MRGRGNEGGMHCLPIHWEAYAAEHRGSERGAGLESLRLEDNHLLATAGGSAPQLITASTLAAVAAEVRPLAV